RAKHSSRPSLIAVKTTIGFGAPQAGTNAVHGNPLGTAGLTSLRQQLGWQAAPFTVMPAVAKRAQQLILQRGQRAHCRWQSQREALPQAVQHRFEQQLSMRLPVDLATSLPIFDEGAQASRITSHTVIQKLAAQLPGLVGGAA
ncbi:transketolase, partial [Streptococcus thermophilus]|nr:transketolase [Streptococcus thermophilus]